MRKAPLIGIGIVIGAIAIAVAGGTPTKTGDLNVSGSASISGSAYIGGSAFQAGQQVVSNAGTGLTKSGSTLFLYTGCSTNQILKWNGTAWACGPDAGGFDTAGSGLGSSGTTVFLNITPTSCGAGSGVTGINSLGSATCSADVTSVVGGTGISASTTSGAATVTANLAGASCAAGSAMTALSATGTGTCSTLATIGAVAGTGTTNFLPKFTSSTAIGNSHAADDGTSFIVTSGGIFSVNESTGATTIGGPLTANFPKTIGPFSLSATQNNYSPTGFAGSLVVRVVPTTNIHITGFAAQSDGYTFTLLNADTVGFGVTLDHESASSTITNRLELPDQQDGWPLYAGCAVTFQYNASIGVTTTGRWQALSWSCDGFPRIVGNVVGLNNTIQGNLNVGGTETTSSWLTVGTSIYAGGSPATEYLSAGVGGIGHTASLNCGYSNNSATTCYINTDGYAESTTQPRSLWVQDGQGSASSHSIIQTDGSTRSTTFPTTTGANTFVNTPSGGGGSPDGVDIERFDDMLGEVPTSVTGGGSASIGDWTLYTSGTGAAVAEVYDVTNGAGRPGQRNLAYSASTGAGGYAAMVGGLGYYLPDGNTTFDTALEFPTLSSTGSGVASLYLAQIGFTTGYTGVAPTNGCYFAYDAGNQLTGGVNGSFVQALECWCAKSGTRTGYLINNTGNSDESFPLGVGTVAAGTWYRLAVVITASTRAEFYRNGTKVCDINTNLPSATTIQVQPAISIITKQATGTGARSVGVDWARTKVHMTAVRSP